MNEEQEEYKNWVKQKLQALNSIFAKASIGDFSLNVDIPAQEDEFTELYVGVQVMLEVIREKITEFEELNKNLDALVKQRTAELVEVQKTARLGSWSWDIAKNSVNWSDVMYDIYGYKKGMPVTFEKAMERVLPEYAEKINKDLGLALKAGKQPPPADYKIKLPDGSIRYLHGEGRLFIRAGKPVKMVGTVIDVSGLKTKEIELSHKTAELEKINKFMVGREISMIELKKKVRELEQKLSARDK